MTTKLGKEFDIQDYLINTENNPEAFFKGCVEEDLGDGSLVRRALGEMVKAKRQLPAFFYSLPRGSLKTATVA